MWIFKKRKKVEPIIDSKYKLKETVGFRYRNDLRYGFITKIYKDDNGNVLYNIQFGGECPAFLKGVKENNLVKLN